MYMYNWFTLLCTWNEYNILNQLYTNKKISLSKKKKKKRMFTRAGKKKKAWCQGSVKTILLYGNHIG